ncbi:MAG: hypothetical protein AAB438_02715 [Patescibacteria group bacterium]
MKEGPDFNSRRNFLKKSFTMFAGGAALSAVPKSVKDFAVASLEQHENDPEEERIKEFLNGYNEKYPSLEEKMKEQKKWFLEYLDSEVYRKLLITEVMNGSKGTEAPSHSVIEEMISQEIKKRKSLIENAVFLSKEDPDSSQLIYAATKTFDEMTKESLALVDGDIQSSEAGKKYHAIVFNKTKYNLDPKNPYWNNTLFAHELHHISLKGGYFKYTDNLFKTNLSEADFKEEVITKYALDTKELLKPKENMAAIIEVRKMLHDLGKMDSFNDKFTEKHILYLKKYAKDLFPKSVVSVNVLFGDAFTDKEIPNEKLLEMMNNFADVSIPEDPNSRWS